MLSFVFFLYSSRVLNPGVWNLLSSSRRDNVVANDDVVWSRVKEWTPEDKEWAEMVRTVCGILLIPLLLPIEGPCETVERCNGCWGVDVDKAGRPRPKNAGIPLTYNQSCKKAVGLRVPHVRMVSHMWGDWGRFQQNSVKSVENGNKKPILNDVIHIFCNLKVRIRIHFEENLKTLNFTRRKVEHFLQLCLQHIRNSSKVI